MYVIRYMEIQMSAFQILLSVDPSLGRVDCSLLSDQTLMELLFDGFDAQRKKYYQDNDGVYLSVCDWSCIKCDDYERVINISVDSRDISGSIQLCYVPPKVKELRIWHPLVNSKLTGPVDLAHLPEGMQFLDLRSNELMGEVDLGHLPEGMEDLRLSNNQLTGEVDLAHLPKRMQKLFLELNRFTGEIDLAHLPEVMNVLRLQCNQFTGEIDLTRLPDGMEHLFLENNRLSGSLVLKRLPPGIRTINARRNNFNVVAVVHSEAHAAIKLEVSGVTSVVDGNGREQNMNRFLT